jgi:hypothetical protein
LRLNTHSRTNLLLKSIHLIAIQEFTGYEGKGGRRKHRFFVCVK